VLDRRLLFKKLQRHRPALVKFTRDLIAIPSFSGREGPAVRRTHAEMRKAGFDAVRIDRMGNVIGRIGRGRIKILFDAHLDTVGVGDRGAWRHDPFRGKHRGGFIHGRGATDQKSAMASIVYAGRLIKELGLGADCTFLAVGSCMEEDCEGAPLRHIIEKERIRPDFVVITEPSALRICRGQRGRMEMKVALKGRSCHASVPERGVNAISGMAAVIREIDALNSRLRPDPFLGKGSVAVTKIESGTPSLNAVPDQCAIYLDRRLTAGETLKGSLAEIRRLKSVRKLKAEVTVPDYEALSWRGVRVAQPKHFPAWVTPRRHALIRAAEKAGRLALGRPPVVGKWAFSTNGVATAGRLKIPTVGFGPSDDLLAHTTTERVGVDELLKAAVFYAALPHLLASGGS